MCSGPDCLKSWSILSYFGQWSLRWKTAGQAKVGGMCPLQAHLWRGIKKQTGNKWKGFLLIGKERWCFTAISANAALVMRIMGISFCRWQPCWHIGEWTGTLYNWKQKLLHIGQSLSFGGFVKKPLWLSAAWLEVNLYHAFSRVYTSISDLK